MHMVGWSVGRSVGVFVSPSPSPTLTEVYSHSVRVPGETPAFHGPRCIEAGAMENGLMPFCLRQKPGKASCEMVQSSDKELTRSCMGRPAGRRSTHISGDSTW